MDSKKKIYFRADASEQIGYGHFIRSLALADMLKDNFECVFFTQNPTAFQQAEVNKVCKLEILSDDARKFDMFIANLTGSEIVVLDNYFYTADYERLIKEKGCKVVSIGSNNRHYCADVIINFTKLRPTDFSAENYTRFCLGLEWTILRKPFYQKSTKSKDGVVICIGGTDQYAYSELFYDTLKQAYQSLKISIIATDRIGKKRIDAFQKKDVELLLNLTAEQMAFQFAKAEIAIVSASSVAIEALSQSAKVIAGYYVNNQINIYHTLHEEGYIWGIDDFNGINCKTKLLNSLEEIEQGKYKKIYESRDTIHLYNQLFSELCK